VLICTAKFGNNLEVVFLRLLNHPIIYIYLGQITLTSYPKAITCLQFDDRWIVAGGGIHDETFDLSSLFVDKSV